MLLWAGGGMGSPIPWRCKRLNGSALGLVASLGGAGWVLNVLVGSEWGLFEPLNGAFGGH